MEREQLTKITLYYDIDDIYREGKDSIHVVRKNYPYTFSIKFSELLTPVIDLYEKHKEDALQDAAYDEMSDYGEFIANVYK